MFLVVNYEHFIGRTKRESLSNLSCFLLCVVWTVHLELPDFCFVAFSQSLSTSHTAWILGQKFFGSMFLAMSFVKSWMQPSNLWTKSDRFSTVSSALLSSVFAPFKTFSAFYNCAALNFCLASDSAKDCRILYSSSYCSVFATLATICVWLFLICFLFDYKLIDWLSFIA